MSPVEAQARRYLRLVPAWLRPTRGEEILGLVLDQVPPSATTLPARSKVDLVRAGLHARRVGSPPFWVWYQVALSQNRAGRPIPVTWLPWLASVVRRRSFIPAMALVRCASVVVLAAIYAFMPYAGLASAAGMLIVGAVVLAWSLATGGPFRRAVCTRHGLGPDGRLLPPGQVRLAWMDSRHANHAIRPLTAIAAAGAAIALAPSGWVWRDARLDAELRPLFVVVLLVSVVTTIRPLLRLGGAAPTGPPTRWRGGPESGRIDRALAKGLPFLAGAALTWAATWLALAIGLLPLAVIPVGILGVARLLVGRTEARVARSIGAWDLVPAWAPQVIVVDEDLESRRPRWGTPA